MKNPYRMSDPGRRDGFKGFEEDKHPRDGHGKFSVGDHVVNDNGNVKKVIEVTATGHKLSDEAGNKYVHKTGKHGPLRRATAKEKTTFKQNEAGWGDDGPFGLGSTYNRRIDR